MCCADLGQCWAPMSALAITRSAYMKKAFCRPVFSYLASRPYYGRQGRMNDFQSPIIWIGNNGPANCTNNGWLPPPMCLGACQHYPHVEHGYPCLGHALGPS